MTSPIDDALRRAELEEQIRAAFPMSLDDIKTHMRNRLPKLQPTGPRSYQDRNWEVREWIEGLVEYGEKEFHKEVVRMPFLLLDDDLRVMLFPQVMLGMLEQQHYDEWGSLSLDSGWNFSRRLNAELGKSASPLQVQAIRSWLEYWAEEHEDSGAIAAWKRYWAVPECDQILLKKWGLLESIDVTGSILEKIEILPGGHCSRVYATKDRVAKIPFQGEEQTTGMLAALRLAGHGGPRIYDHDGATGALLMDRIAPGMQLAEAHLLTFDQMREVFIEHFLAMRDVPTAGMMPLREWWTDPAKREAAERLNATAPKIGFLHGDLHHHNLLLGADDKYVAIDPKGLVGDIHWEVIAWLRNPVERLQDMVALATHVVHELDALSSALKLDPNRILDWAILDSAGHSNPYHPWAKLPKVYRELRG